MDKNSCFGALHAVDALGRRLPGEQQVGSLRENRAVGVFYFLTHGAYPSKEGPNDISVIMKNHPEAIHDFYHPAWGKGSLYWGEPLFGYYQLKDKWVLRRHAKLLTMAGADFIIFDTTNRITFKEQVLPILEVFDEYRKEGWNVPKIAYYTNTLSGETVEEIYNDIYKPGLYKDLWFYWEGKPFIVGLPWECSEEIQNFFTFRLSQWPTEQQKEGGCPWIDFERPQRVWKTKDGENEIVPVSVAQHPNLSFGDGAFYDDPAPRGRAFRNYKNDKTPEALVYGYNVQEQWERAFELDPRMVFFTGWNEWTAGKIQGDKDRPVLMVDQADAEYSRDVEPMRGGFFDNYYMQLCQNIRRYKGAPKAYPVNQKKAVAPRSGFYQFDSAPVYSAMPFGTLPRDFDGIGSTHYTNNTGRNEFESIRVMHDDTHIAFYAKMKNDIVFNMFTKWMTLFISIEGRPYAPDWHGYHYIVNDIVLDKSATFLQTSLGGYRWGNSTRIPYEFSGNEIAVFIPRKCLDIENGPFRLYFKWADHTGYNENIEDFYEFGDCAPYGRFSFIYEGE
ncbi:MAG: hypothetical protein IJC48_05530 [Clostridia bacterium]|nr:hypothetical protein [Clostridia bacterium]